MTIITLQEVLQLSILAINLRPVVSCINLPKMPHLEVKQVVQNVRELNIDRRLANMEGCRTSNSNNSSCSSCVASCMLTNGSEIK